MGYKPKKKRVMRHFKINELSAVDMPAQEGARMTIMKRAGDEVSEYVEKRAWLTEDAPDGHAHLILAAGDTAGFTSMNGADDESWHIHPWISDEDGGIVIGANNGHSHGVRENTMKMLLPEEWVAKLSSEAHNDHDEVMKEIMECVEKGVSMETGSLPIRNSADFQAVLKKFDFWGDKPKEIRHIMKRAEDLSLGLPTEGELATIFEKAQKEVVTSKENKNMTKDKNKDNEPTLDELKKQVEDTTSEKEKLETELAVSKKLAEMTDAHKEHYNSLDTEAAVAFLEKSADERDRVIAKAAEKDKVVYTATDGTEYRKSDDPRMIALAKKADADAKEVEKMRTKAADAEYTKRAEELPHLPGTTEAKVSMLKSIDRIEDEDQRKEALDALKASNSEMAKAFEEHGIGSDPEAKSAEDELEKLAKSYAKDHDVTVEQAYSEVMRTEEGAELYEQTTQH